MAKRGPKPKAAHSRKNKKSPQGKGKRGPAKTPVAKLKVHGSRLAKDREPHRVYGPASNVVQGTITFPSGMPDRPTWINKERRKIWTNLISLYKKTMPDMLSEIDLYVLARYCDLLAWYIKLRKEIEIEGEEKSTFNKAGHEYFSANPKVSIALKISTQLIKLENELYLTPAARQGIVATAKPKQDSLSEYLSRGA